MKATAMVYLKSGAMANVDTTRDALKAFWQRRSDDVRAALVDICLTRWFWSPETGWQRGAKFRYVPSRPDLWQVPNPTLKPTSASPFDN